MRLSSSGLLATLGLAVAGCAYIPTDPKVTALSEGVAITISGSGGTVKYFTFFVPVGAPGLHVEVSGGTGDANLYLRHGARPTDGASDCASLEVGNVDDCQIVNPVAGTWHIAVVANEAYADLALLADIVTPVAKASPATRER